MKWIPSCHWLAIGNRFASELFSELFSEAFSEPFSELFSELASQPRIRENRKI